MTEPGAAGRADTPLLHSLFSARPRLGWEHRPQRAVVPDTPPPAFTGDRAAYDRAMRRWQHVQQLFRVQTAPVWFPVGATPAAHVLMLFGGTGVGWEAFLTTSGASALGAGQSVTVLRLSARCPAIALPLLARQRGFAVTQDEVSRDGATVDLFAQLDAAAMVDLVLETGSSAAEAQTRAEYQQDKLLLVELVERLGGRPITVRRLAAALQVVAGANPLALARDLSADEAAELLVLYPDEARQQGGLVQRAVRLRAHLASLMGLTPAMQAPAPAAPPALWLVSVGERDALADVDLAADLAGMWLLRRLRRGEDARPNELVYVFGADRLRRPVLEALVTIAERREIPIVLAFERLRDVAAELIGYGSSCALFMRLQNAEEAQSAATYVGVDEVFKLSQTTSTTGGQSGRSFSEQESTEESRSSSLNLGQAFGRSIGRSLGRSQGTSASREFGTNWSIASTEQLVEDLVLKPHAVQSLGHTAVVVVDKLARRRTNLIDCNPSIVESRRVSPLPAPEWMP